MLALIFNELLSWGDWLHTNVSPVCKKVKNTLPLNCANYYRPVSLTCICSVYTCKQYTQIARLLAFDSILADCQNSCQPLTRDKFHTKIGWWNKSTIFDVKRYSSYLELCQQWQNIFKNKNRTRDRRLPGSNPAWTVRFF